MKLPKLPLSWLCNWLCNLQRYGGGKHTYHMPVFVRSISVYFLQPNVKLVIYHSRSIRLNGGFLNPSSPQI